jgi:hypothetical protein
MDFSPDEIQSGVIILTQEQTLSCSCCNLVFGFLVNTENLLPMGSPQDAGRGKTVPCKTKILIAEDDTSLAMTMGHVSPRPPHSDSEIRVVQIHCFGGSCPRESLAR